MPSNGEQVTTPLQRIANRARRSPDEPFNNLLHVLTKEFLADCFHALRKDAAAGVDRVTAHEYAQGLDDRLSDLVARIHRMGYHPQPVRRVYIPKDKKSLRPLGIPALEDKLVQEGMRRILEAIYEDEFLECSYGFRPKRSCHTALQALETTLTKHPVNYVIDADIKGFFDHVDHSQLLGCLEKRITDKRFLRYIIRFLKTGVVEKGTLLPSEGQGVPQGGVISPILSNIFLHYALDRWFTRQLLPTLRGYAALNRYADDFVICVQYPDEARHVMKELRERLTHCHLTLAEEKTRLIVFSAQESEKVRLSGLPAGTFDYLGFTHFWYKTRKGNRFIGRCTSRKKFRQKVRAMKDWLQSMQQTPIREIWPTLKAKLQGHFNYYGISGNTDGIRRFNYLTERLVFKQLNRCSQRRRWNWDEYKEFLQWYPLPQPRIVHRWWG